MKISTEIKIGLIVLLGVICLIIGINFLKGGDFLNRRITVFTIYDDVDGIAVGTTVTYKGLSIGTVQGVDYFKEKNIVVMAIRKDIGFSSNIIAEIYESSLISGKAIRFINNDYSNASIKLKKGDTIRSKMDKGFLDKFSEKSEPLETKVTNILSNVDTISTTFSKVLHPKKESDFNETIEYLTETIKNLYSITSTLEKSIKKNEKNLNSILEGTNSSISNLKSITDSLSDSNLKQAVANFEKILSETSLLLDTINNSNGSVNKLIKDPDLYNNITSSTEELKLLLEDLRENPKRYVHFSLFGKKQKPYKEEKK